MNEDITYKAEPDMGRGWQVVAYDGQRPQYCAAFGMTKGEAGDKADELNTAEREFEAAVKNAANGVSS